MKARRLLTLLMVVVLFLQPVATMAAGTFDDYAQELNRLRLFKGTDNGFELDRAPSRAEALVMLIRLLGKESEALAYTPPAGGPGHPFTDVPAWVEPYVAYAYQNGLTRGVAPDRFGSTDTVTANQYFTFVLRSLGYSDSAGDFEWSKAAEKAHSIGIVTREDYSQAGGDFLRGNLVDISYNALSASIKGEETTLLEKLVTDGAVPADALPKAKAVARLEGTKLIVPLEPSPSFNGQTYYQVDAATIAAALPSACHLRYAWSMSGYAESLSLQERYLMTVGSLLAAPNQQSEQDWFSLPASLPPDGGSYNYYLLDEDFNLVGYASLHDLAVSDETAELTFETSIPFDCAALTSGIIERAGELSSGAYEFSNDLFVHHTYTYLQYDQTQGANVEKEEETMVVDRAGLPEYARGFTRCCFIGFYWLPDEALASGLKQVNSVDDVDMAEQLLKERVGYLTGPARQRSGYAVKYDDEFGIRLNVRSWTSQFSFLVVILQDDAGYIKAYTYFTADELAAIATE